MNNTDASQFLTVPQIANLTNYTRAQAWNWARKGLIPSERTNPGGKQFRYKDTPMLRVWCQERRIRQLSRPSANSYKAISGQFPRNGDLLNKTAAAKRLAISQRTLDYWIKDGSIPFVKLGKLIRFIPADIEQFITSRRVGSFGPRR